MPFPLTTEQFIAKAKLKHGEKYDYSLADYKHNLTAVKIICPIHGMFEQRPCHHLRGNNQRGSGCPSCYKISVGQRARKWNTDTFIEACKKLSPNYDYSKVSFIRTDKPVIVICPIHGEWKIAAANLLLGTGCKKCNSYKVPKITKEKIIQRANLIHANKYSYELLPDKIYLTSKATLICPIHGNFEQIICNHLKGNGCHSCAKKAIIKARQKGRKASLYIIQCKNDSEVFYKVGITFTLKRRLREIPYETEIVKSFQSMDVGFIFDLESKIKLDMAEYRYTPQIYFGGISECFSQPIDLEKYTTGESRQN